MFSRASFGQRFTSENHYQILEVCPIHCSLYCQGYICFVPLPTCCLAMNKPQAGSIKIKAKRLSIRRTRSPNRMAAEAMRHEGFDQDRESSLPPNLRSRLWTLFAQIEREFECVHAENLACKYTKLFYLVCISSFDKIID